MELIDRVALRNYFEQNPEADFSSADVVRTIDYMPAIDAVQVVHARWEFADDQYCRCTGCHQKAPVVLQYQDEPETIATDYCPHCGALMDADAPEHQQNTHTKDVRNESISGL